MGTIVAGQYRIRGCIGRGRQAEVYLAEDIRNGHEPVALKMYRATDVVVHHLNDEVEAGRRLTNAYHILAPQHLFRWSFANPSASGATVLHTVTETTRASDATAGDVRYVIVMPFAGGGDLGAYIENQPQPAFPPDLACHFSRHIIEALACAHARGVAHRDLKPGNVLVTLPDYNVFVADWGLSAAWNGGVDALLSTFCGTAMYMAPEVLATKTLGEQYMACPADMWTVGVLMFIFLAGFPPFNEATNADWWYQRLVNGQRDVFWYSHERFATFPPAAKQLLDCLLVIDPARRWTAERVRECTWFQQTPMPFPGDLAREMQRRAALAMLPHYTTGTTVSGNTTVRTDAGSGVDSSSRRSSEASNTTAAALHHPVPPSGATMSVTMQVSTGNAVPDAGAAGVVSTVYGGARPTQMESPLVLRGERSLRSVMRAVSQQAAATVADMPSQPWDDDEWAAIKVMPGQSPLYPPRPRLLGHTADAPTPLH